MGSIFRSIFIDKKYREQRNKYITPLDHDESKRTITKEEVYHHDDNNNDDIADLKNVTFTINNQFINITSFEPKVPDTDRRYYIRDNFKETPIKTGDPVYGAQNWGKIMSSVSIINKNRDKIKKS